MRHWMLFVGVDLGLQSGVETGVATADANVTCIFVDSMGQAEKLLAQLAEAEPVDPPCVVVLDRLPAGEAAPDAIKSLRRSAPRIMPPILVIEKGEGSHWRAECYRAGANSVVSVAANPNGYKKNFEQVTRYWAGLNQPRPR